MGSALSRWTMSYFAAALLSLMVAEAMMAAGYGFPAVPLEAPETLVLVHIVAIGWLSLLMCGALLQFVPVLVARPLKGQRLVLPALLCLLAGLLCLLAGFLDLAGTLDIGFPLLPVAAILLASGFLSIVVVITTTLWSVPPSQLPLAARFVAVGVVCLVVTFAWGATFAFALSGFAPFDVRAVGLPIHVAMGLGGWLTFSAIGVSYRLLPMFMLSPEKERFTSRAVWWCGVLALLLVLAQLPEDLAGGPGISGFLAPFLAAAMLFLYGIDLVLIYRGRKRRQVELNVKAAAGAFATLFASSLLLLGLVTYDAGQSVIGALAYLVAMGWLAGLGLSQLYKIVPFLTWLECYGRSMGRKPTPRVQDLVVERRGRIWFGLYFMAVMAAAGGLLVGSSSTFRLASGVVLVDTAAIVAELIAARRLWNVPVTGLPGASRLRLFLPQF